MDSDERAAKKAEVEVWLAKADVDLRAAAFEFTASPPFVEDICFHAQQAAEKAMKAFLTWHDRPFRKTHDLGEIGIACVAIDASLEDVLKEAAPLTEYAWRFRYPADLNSPSASPRCWTT